MYDMKNIIGILIAAIGLAFLSCEPVENRNEMTGRVTDAEITKYVTVEQQTIEGKKSNYFTFKSEGLKAITSFKHGLGTYVGVNTKDFIQCYVVAGEAQIVVTVLNPDGSAPVTKTFNFTVEEAFNVAPEWELFCGTGSKTWGWNVDKAPFHGMGDVNDDNPGWWSIPNPESRIAGDGVGATLTFNASGATLTKTKTTGATEIGTFAFDMSKTWPGYPRSMGQLTTSGVTVLAGRNTAGGEFINVYEIIKLTEDEMMLITVDGGASWRPEDEGWGQATHWLFKAE